MKLWSVQDAKEKFSEFLDDCLTIGPQIVSKNGTAAAVLIPIAQWNLMNAEAKPSLKDVLLSDIGRTGTLVPERGRGRARARRRSFNSN